MRANAAQGEAQAQAEVLLAPAQNEIIDSESNDFMAVHFRWAPVSGVRKYLITVHDRTNGSIRREWESQTFSTISLFVGHEFDWSVTFSAINALIKNEPVLLSTAPTPRVFKIVKLNHRADYGLLNPWKRFELGPNYILQNPNQYSLGFHLGYAPPFSIAENERWALVPRISLEIDKEVGARVFPNLELDLQIRFLIQKEIYLSSGLGIGDAMQSQVSGGIYPLFDFSFGYRPHRWPVPGNKTSSGLALESVSLIFSQLFSSVSTRQFVLSFGFSFGEQQ